MNENCAMLRFVFNSPAFAESKKLPLIILISKIIFKACHLYICAVYFDIRLEGRIDVFEYNININLRMNSHIFLNPLENMHQLR